MNKKVLYYRQKVKAYMIVVLLVVGFIIFLNVQPAYAVSIVKTNSTSAVIPQGYHFAPRYISGKTTVSLSSAPSGYKWVAVSGTGYYQLQTTAGKASMPSASYKGKIYVKYGNVGFYNGSWLDMKITITNWNSSCRRIEFGRTYIGFGNVSGASGGTAGYMSVKIDYYYAGTSTLYTGLKGHQPVGDMDYWSDTKKSEWLKTGTNSSTKIIIPSDEYSHFDLSNISNNLIGVNASGGGGTSNSDGSNFIYLFESPSHTITWYGGFLRMNLTCPVKEFQINYMANGGTGTMSPTLVKYGVSTKLAKNTFKKTGYHFDGWHVYREYDDSWNLGSKWGEKPSSDSSYSHYKDQGTVAKTAPCGNVYMYACWKANTYSVKYHANGGSGSMSASSHTYDSTQSLTANSFSREGYTFKGWNTKADGTGTSYTNQQVVKNLTAVNGGAIDLYAQWSVNSYTNSIAHLALGFINGEGNNSSKNMYEFSTTNFSSNYNAQFTMNENRKASIPNGFKLSGSTFGTSSIDGTWKSYLFDTVVTQKPKSMYFEYYYYPEEYNITYELSGGTNSSDNPSSYNILYGFRLNHPTREDYEFLGWYLDGVKVTGINEGCNGSFENSNQMYNELSSRMSGDITLVAKWGAKFPSIYTNSNYYFKDSQVSIEELCKNASAKDDVDGDISNKISISYIEYPDGFIEENPSELKTDSLGTVIVEYQVKNSLGYETKKTDVVFIIEQGSKTLLDRDHFIYSRFISNQLLDDGNYSLDTLNYQSIWLTSSYHNILMQSINNDTYLEEYDYVNQKSFISQFNK